MQIIGIEEMLVLAEQQGIQVSDDEFNAESARMKNAADHYVRECVILRKFESANNAFYYGRPHESFSTPEAVELAKKAGAEILILDDMS